MAQNPDALVRATDASSYRCPGCGEVVDSRRIDQVLQHHQHVLRQPYPPAWFNATTHPHRTAANALATVAPGQPEAPAQAFTGTADEVQRRRYGH